MDWLDELLEATEPEPLDDAIASHLRDDDPIEALKLAKSLPRTSIHCCCSRAVTSRWVRAPLSIHRLRFGHSRCRINRAREYCLYDYMWH